MYDGMKRLDIIQNPVSPFVAKVVTPPSTADIKLYWSLASPPSRAVKALLVAGDIEHDEQLIDVTKGQGKTPEMLKLNPLGTVPFVVVKGKTYTDSQAIMRYLAMKYPSLNKYYPNKTPENKAHIDIGLDFCCTSLKPTSVSTFVPIVFARMAGKEPTPEMIKKAEEGEEALKNMYFFMNNGLSNWGKKGPAQFGSNHYSIGDFMIFC
jgi:glutathione S-transferase